MYAIIQAGGRQYRVAPGERLLVDRMFAEPGSQVQFADVRLLAPDGSDALIGTPVVTGALVEATVLGHPRGEKIIVFKYKPKKRYRRRLGFRAALTEVRIDTVALPGTTAARRASARSARSRPGGQEAPASAPTPTAEPAAPRARSGAGTAPDPTDHEASAAPETSAPGPPAAPRRRAQRRSPSDGA